MTVTEEGYSKSWRGNLARGTSNASITNVTPIVNKRLAPLQLGINTRGNYSGNLNAWPVLIASFSRRLTASQEISETIFLRLYPIYPSHRPTRVFKTNVRRERTKKSKTK